MKSLPGQFWRVAIAAEFAVVSLIASGASAGVVYQRTSGVAVTGVSGLISASPSGTTFGEAGGYTFNEAGGTTFNEAGGLLFTNPAGTTFGEAGGTTFGEAGGTTFGEAGGTTFGEAGGTTFGEAGGTTFGEAGGGVLGTSASFSESKAPSIDLELLALLALPADSSSLNVVVTYRSYPTAADFEQLRSVGIFGGTVLRNLPMISVNATRDQVRLISRFTSVRSLYSNRNLLVAGDSLADEVFASAADLRRETFGPAGATTGRGIGVAVVDTGIDATHPDLRGRVAENLHVVSGQGTQFAFSFPILSSQADTDLVYGHGTFVAGLIAGQGIAANGKVRGLAPAAHLVGVSVGQLTLVYALEGLDAVMAVSRKHNIRVVNCSFGVQGFFDAADPMNIATAALSANGIVPVMAAGNHGPTEGSISPYAVAPWVIGVAGTDGMRRLAAFSSRGYFGDLVYAPTISAPAVDLISLRATGTTLTGAGSESAIIAAGLDPLLYSAASGTSFSTAVVSALLARMFEGDAKLDTATAKAILQNTATPLPQYDRSQIGAGTVNFAAALHKTLNRGVPYGSLLKNYFYQNDFFFSRGQRQNLTAAMSIGEQVRDFAIAVPETVASLHVALGWGPQPSPADLDIALIDPSGKVRASSSQLNLPYLSGASESLAVRYPQAGQWTLRARAKTAVVTGTSLQLSWQAVSVSHRTLDVTDPRDREAMELLVRARVFPNGRKLRGSELIDRGLLAVAFAAFGQPRFLPVEKTFSDVGADHFRLFAESAAGGAALTPALFGPHFTATTAAVPFNGQAIVTRIEFCRAIVRFTNREAEALAQAGAVIPTTDGDTLSPSDRGYASVALRYGLIDTVDNRLEPAASLTSKSMAQSFLRSTQ